ncbi:Oligosaccharide translocation protein rft1 [Rhizina undulata]
MAMSSSKNKRSSSSNLQNVVSHQLNAISPMRSPVMASCYATCSTGVQGFHYSSTGTDGSRRSPSGRQPASNNGKGASRIIAKECERLLCRDMKRIFLGGGNDSKSVPVSMASIYNDNNEKNSIFGSNNHRIINGNNGCGNVGKSGNDEMQFIEVWDYVGGGSFRGFIAERPLPGNRMDRTIFLFFEQVAGTQLKHGLIALIELATECFNCDTLVICLDRKTEGLHSLIRDLGWVGFELVTLSRWLPSNQAAPSTRSDSFSSTSTSYSNISSVDDDVTSDTWLFVGMEL